jgi:hypothetical protein
MNSKDLKHRYYQWQVIVDPKGVGGNNISHTCLVGKTACYVLKTTNF